jgi:hypothetical protein
MRESTPLFDPPLEAPVAGLVRRVALGQVVPGCSGAQNPKDAVEDVSGVSPRPATTVDPTKMIGDQRFEHFPLLVGKVHAPPRLEELNA